MIARRRIALGLAAFAFAAGGPTDAGAQLQLPGALGGSPAGTPPRESGNTGGSEGPKAAPKPIVVKPPTEDTILGHALVRNGVDGAMTFDRQGQAAAGDVALTKLSVTGDKISSPTKTCSLDVALASPIVAKAAGRPAGAIRYEVPLAACPFTIDVLDGAVLVATPTPTCEFKAADCRVELGGLWGPAAADITDKRAKDLERERVRIETTMRANFRVLLHRAGKDRAAVKALAGEQAGFSSQREMACRDYKNESVHGFCSTQMTEARVLALLSKFGPDLEKEEHRHAAHDRAKATRAAPAAAPADEEAPAQDASPER
ncbi:hypothetical protein RHAL1_00714 [Beijerinckiaceae bacterium RH AL1]|nr:hypothetical protein [Beijerinckiaceae bacterium]VVB43416.1 hypothetical protein RHAL8_00682 [Beijerinckiaceae bacterium RH AL8]VVB43431.1 hypothetical protein RHCH11_RHCH11_00684 [Beijerinckiaceae bacterium RH CH11]VVC53830.1 hypothetical protein RHAL1_00714 [Beijerinckiaceae bacterium RH AL1]